VEHRVFTSFEDARAAWEQLNDSYKGGELCLDWETHRLIWEDFYGPRGYDLAIHAGFRGQECRWCVPLVRTVRDPYGAPSWSFSDEVLIGREYLCRPEELEEMARAVPPHLSDDLSCFHGPPGAPGGWETLPGSVVDLREDTETYLATLSRSSRKDLRQALRRNADLEVLAGTVFPSAAVEALLPGHLATWARRAGGEETPYFDYCRQKTRCDLRVLRRAAELGRLVSLELRLGGMPVAVNLAVRREGDRVDDYLCVRDGRPELLPRGLGLFAILANMETCRGLGIRWYDLSAGITSYKARFLNAALTYRRPVYPGAELRDWEPAPGMHPTTMERS